MTIVQNRAFTPESFRLLKQRNQKIVMLTAYDYTGAQAVAESQVDVILVGDSLGMVMLGYESTLNVTMEDMISHSAATRRGAPGKFIIADMPYLSYHLSTKKTKQNAARLILEGRVNAVKLEGGTVSRLDAIQAIVDIEIPVCAHLGLTPQSIMRYGEYKVQGRTDEEHDCLIEQAVAVEKAGAFMLVLEGIPELLGKKISEAVSIPTIGIGAGRFCDGQVLVFHDMLGFSEMLPKFVKPYASMKTQITNAIDSYCMEVRSGDFPTNEHIYYPINQR